MIGSAQIAFGAQERIRAAVFDAATAAKVLIPDTPGSRNGRLLEAAREAGLSDVAIARAVASALDIKFIEDLADRTASALFMEKIPIGFARDHKVLGLAAENGAM